MEFLRRPPLQLCKRNAAGGTQVQRFKRCRPQGKKRFKESKDMYLGFKKEGAL